MSSRDPGVPPALGVAPGGTASGRSSPGHSSPGARIGRLVRRASRVALAIVAGTALAAVGVRAGAQEPLVLRDQFGRTHDERAWEGRVRVIVAGDRPSRPAFEAWLEALRPLDVTADTAADGDGGARVRIIRVIDLRGVPRPMHRMARRFAPKTDTVLLDFAGVLARRYDLPAGRVVVLVLDRAGRVAGRVDDGPADLARVERLLAPLVRR